METSNIIVMYFYQKSCNELILEMATKVTWTNIKIQRPIDAKTLC